MPRSARIASHGAQLASLVQHFSSAVDLDVIQSIREQESRVAFLDYLYYVYKRDNPADPDHARFTGLYERFFQDMGRIITETAIANNVLAAANPEQLSELVADTQKVLGLTDDADGEA